MNIHLSESFSHQTITNNQPSGPSPPPRGETSPKRSSRIEPLNLIEVAAKSHRKYLAISQRGTLLLSTRRLLLLGEAAIGIRRSRRPVRAERAGASESEAGVRSEATSVIGTKCLRLIQRLVSGPRHRGGRRNWRWRFCDAPKYWSRSEGCLR